ncbi:MAG: hypothetical protein Fur0015_12390 [Ignavibacteriales bacterium]
MENPFYIYKAKVISVYDGDTITVNIDLGFNTWLFNEKVRLNRINAPEVTGKSKSKGIQSRDFLRSQILGKDILIETLKDKKEKYGRYLGEIYLKNSNGESLNINDLMVEKGFAEYKKY